MRHLRHARSPHGRPCAAERRTAARASGDGAAVAPPQCPAEGRAAAPVLSERGQIPQHLQGLQQRQAGRRVRPGVPTLYKGCGGGDRSRTKHIPCVATKADRACRTHDGPAFGGGTHAGAERRTRTARADGRGDGSVFLEPGETTAPSHGRPVLAILGGKAVCQVLGMSGREVYSRRVYGDLRRLQAFAHRSIKKQAARHVASKSVRISPKCTKPTGPAKATGCLVTSHPGCIGLKEYVRHNVMGITGRR